MAQGLGGLMSVTGVPGAEPVKAGFPVADLGGGMWSRICVINLPRSPSRSEQLVAVIND